MTTTKGSTVPPEGMDALTACLLPHSALLGPGAAGFQGRLSRIAERWVKGGFVGPPASAPEDSDGPPDPGLADPEAIDLVKVTHLDDLREAAEWAANARFLGTEQRAALTLLTDVLAIGAAPLLPAYLSEKAAEAILDSFPDVSGPPVTLWRPVAGRASSGLWSAILWNRIAGDPQELHAGPECVAAAVAAAEILDRTLGELLDAIAVGCGVGAWHRDAVGAAMERSGIHPPGALAPVATAAAVGRLNGIGARNMAQALRRASALTPMHPYRASTEGKSAKLLFGAFGQTLGAATVLNIKHPFGLLPAPSLSRRARLPGLEAFAPRDATRAVHGIALKKFPASRAVQSVLAAIEKLPRIAPDAIQSIRVETYPFSAAISGWARPDTGPIAMQSHIPTAVALMIEARSARTPFAAGSFPASRDPATTSLAERTVVEPHEFGDAGAPASRRVRWAKVSIRPKAGPDLTASSGPPFAPAPPGSIRDRFANMGRGAAVRDPHQLPYSAPVRSLFETESPASHPVPPGADDPLPESGDSEGAGGGSEPRRPTLFPQS